MHGSHRRQRPELSLEGNTAAYEEEARVFLVEGAPRDGALPAKHLQLPLVQS